MAGCKPVVTPLETGCSSHSETETHLDDVQSYQRLVGKFIYLSHTRPDICYVVSYVSQFMRAPINIHLQAVMRILRVS